MVKIRLSARTLGKAAEGTAALFRPIGSRVDSRPLCCRRSVLGTELIADRWGRRAEEAPQLGRARERGGTAVRAVILVAAAAAFAVQTAARLGRESPRGCATRGRWRARARRRTREPAVLDLARPQPSEATAPFAPVNPSDCRLRGPPLRSGPTGDWRETGGRRPDRPSDVP